MEKQAERPVGRMLWVAAVAVLAALVAAVSAFAGDGFGTAADAPAASQRQTEPVQDSQAAPEQGEPPARGGRDDCPEREGDGRPEDQSAAPGSGTTTPSPDV